jgi:AcrR family transcriptional regulator
MGPRDAAVRVRLLDATERVLARDGYPAISSRSVGQEAGVDQKLVYYYFRTMEDLVVETFHRRSEVFLAELEKLSKSDKPIRSLWNVSSDRNGRLIIEFMAMAGRNEALHQEVKRYSERAFEILQPALSRFQAENQLDPEIFSPSFLNFLIASLARNLMLDTELGLLPDSQATLGAIDRLLKALGQ